MSEIRLSQTCMRIKTKRYGDQYRKYLFHNTDFLHKISCVKYAKKLITNDTFVHINSNKVQNRTAVKICGTDETLYYFTFFWYTEETASMHTRITLQKV